MKINLINANISIISIICFLDISFLILWIIDLVKPPETDIKYHWYYIGVSFLSIINIILAIQGLILRRVGILIAYGIMYNIFNLFLSSSIILACGNFATFIFFINDGKSGELSLFSALQWSMQVSGIIRIVSTVLIFVNITKIKKETKIAPLSFIDESLTEDLYQNIIDQSQNPENENLKEKYNEITADNRLFKSTLSNDSTAKHNK